MKFTAILILSLFHFSSISQVSKAEIQFAIDVTALDTSKQTKQTVGMFYDSSMKLFFSDTRSRVEFKMGRLYTTTMIMDNTSDTTLVLTASPMGNFAKHQRTSEVAELKPKRDSTVIIQAMDDYKTILGYKCQKVSYRTDSTAIVYWVTDEIKVSEDLGQEIINQDLPGFPLEFTASDASVKYHYKASNIVLEIKDEETVFSTAVPAGFTLMGQFPMPVE